MSNCNFTVIMYFLCNIDRRAVSGRLFLMPLFRHFICILFLCRVYNKFALKNINLRTVSIMIRLCSAAWQVPLANYSCPRPCLGSFTFPSFPFLFSFPSTVYVSIPFPLQSLFPFYNYFQKCSVFLYNIKNIRNYSLCCSQRLHSSIFSSRNPRFTAAQHNDPVTISPLHIL